MNSLKANTNGPNVVDIMLDDQTNRISDNSLEIITSLVHKTLKYVVFLLQAGDRRQAELRDGFMQDWSLCPKSRVPSDS